MEEGCEAARKKRGLLRLFDEIPAKRLRAWLKSLEIDRKPADMKGKMSNDREKTAKKGTFVLSWLVLPKSTHIRPIHVIMPLQTSTLSRRIRR